jgi:hypothetical protein
VLGDQPLELADHPVERGVPRRGLAVEQRGPQAPGSIDRQVLGEALRAEAPAVHRMVRVALHGDRLVVAHADQHAAADGAVAARRAHPGVDGAAGAHRPLDGVGHVLVAIATMVRAKQPRDAIPQSRAR